MLSGSGSALELLEPHEKNEAQLFFLVITAAESLCTNSYIYEKMKKQNLSEWMEIFKFPHDVRKYEVHGLRKCFVGIKP